MRTIQPADLSANECDELNELISALQQQAARDYLFLNAMLNVLVDFYAFTAAKDDQTAAEACQEFIVAVEEQRLARLKRRAN